MVDLTLRVGPILKSVWETPSGLNRETEKVGEKEEGRGEVTETGRETGRKKLNGQGDGVDLKGDWRGKLNVIQMYCIDQIIHNTIFKRSTCCSCRAPKFAFFTHIRQLTNTCYSSSRISKALGTCMHVRIINSHRRQTDKVKQIILKWCISLKS